MSISLEDAPQVSASLTQSSFPVNCSHLWHNYDNLHSLRCRRGSQALFTHTTTHLNMAFVWVILTPSWLSLTCPVSHVPPVISHQSCQCRCQGNNFHPRNHEDFGLGTIQMFNSHSGNAGWTCTYADKNIIHIMFHANLYQWITSICR